MTHKFNMNCLVGDILEYYGTMRLSNTYKVEQDPSTIISEVNIDDIRDHTSHLLITDGIINEFDYADITTNPEGEKELSVRKKVKVCRANYAIHVIYTKVASAYNAIQVYIYMADLSQIDTIYREVPNDIYFW